jgi:SAM-dependent methyltransferase
MRHGKSGERTKRAPSQLSNTIDGATVVTKTLCRACNAPLSETFADLGMSPLANSFVPASQIQAPETFYPLHARVCSRCLLVQLDYIADPGDIFRDYLYFSSFSQSWLEHCSQHAAAAISSLGLDAQSLVVEIASNDGYLLQYFKSRHVPVLGIEPAANVAKLAIEKGIPTEVIFFNSAAATQLKNRGITANLIIANNVLAHVPDINDFVVGIKILLAHDGVVHAEFPHLMTLIEEGQFDTIYHEHYSYFSLKVIVDIFARKGLTVFDVEVLPTHGGSLRIFAAHSVSDRVASTRMATLCAAEESAGIGSLETYRDFARRVIDTKIDLLAFLIEAKRQHRRVVGYGAPAKGNTLLNYCGVGPELLEFTVDRSPYKQGTFLPGVRIPVLHPDAILEAKPDYVLILPWNLRDEIVTQLAAIHAWGGKFVTAIPKLKVF